MMSEKDTNAANLEFQILDMEQYTIRSGSESVPCSIRAPSPGHLHTAVTLRSSQIHPPRLNSDGWEDGLRRSLYGTLAARRRLPPFVLGLHNMSGERGSGEAIAGVVEKAVERSEIDMKKQVIAFVTDNPTTMRKVRRLIATKYPHIITLPCFLHKLNTIIGKILDFKPIKADLSRVAKIVSYFLGSHYWGGQLEILAKQHGVTRGLKVNTESRWYAFIKQCLSVQEHR